MSRIPKLHRQKKRSKKKKRRREEKKRKFVLHKRKLNYQNHGYHWNRKNACLAITPREKAE